MLPVVLWLRRSPSVSFTLCVKPRRIKRTQLFYKTKRRRTRLASIQNILDKNENASYKIAPSLNCKIYITTKTSFVLLLFYVHSETGTTQLKAFVLSSARIFAERISGLKCRRCGRILDDNAKN